MHRRQALGIERASSFSELDNVTSEEISKIVHNTPAKHCSLDRAPTWLVKQLLPLLAETLAKICNASFHEGSFPETLKLALVRPRLKKPSLNADVLNSFRPISNLSFLSKLVERVAAVRISAHIESQQLLPSCQSAYRAHHSTETAIVAVHDDLVRSIDSSDICALVVLDVSAAFDTVDHQSLLQVLSRRFAVADTALNWYKSYLSQCTQTFSVNDQMSGPHSVSCSIPQGSVLGPLKFAAYAKDLDDVIDNNQLNRHMYADDTQLIASTSVNRIQPTIVRLQTCIADIHSWCRSRRLQAKSVKN